MTAVTAALAGYAATARREDLPESVRHQGVRALVNWVGCAAGGAREEVVERTLALLDEFAGQREASLVARAERVGTLDAAFLNALSASVLMFNDTHFATVAHPTAPVAAALLALAARRPVTGGEFVHALVLGIEIQCRVGNVLAMPPAQCAVGLSMAGLVGGIGAAVGVGRVLGLDAAGMAAAIGHAANQAAGLRQAHASMASALTPAHAARCGLFAALMAARGIGCAADMIEGPKGFAASYGTHANLEAAVNGLGTTFEIAGLSYKPYPSGFASHAVIDACIEIAGGHGFDLTRIEAVELFVHPVVSGLMDRPHPADHAAAMMSVQHWAAVALTRGAVGLADTAEAAAREPRLCALREKVRLVVDAGLGRESATVRVRFNDGTVRNADVTHCRGSAGQPMSDEDLTQKTRAQLLTVFPAGAAGRIIEACWQIEGCTDINAFARQLGTGHAVA